MALPKAYSHRPPPSLTVSRILQQPALTSRILKPRLGTGQDESGTRDALREDGETSSALGFPTSEVSTADPSHLPSRKIALSLPGKAASWRASGEHADRQRALSGRLNPSTPKA